MPSTSAKQHRFMGAVANNSAFAKKAGVPQSVGKDFSAADKGKRFVGGGALKQKINRQDTQHGAMDMPFKSVKQFGKTVRRFQTGGSTDPDYVDPTIKYTPAQEEWLGKADRSDRYIIDRMKAARPTPAPVEERGIGPKTLAPVEERDINARKPTSARASAFDADEDDRERGRGNLSSSVAAPAASSDAKPAGDKKPAQSNSRITNRGAAPLSEAASQLFDRQPSGRSADDSRRLDRQPKVDPEAAKKARAIARIRAEGKAYEEYVRNIAETDQDKADVIENSGLLASAAIPIGAVRAGLMGGASLATKYANVATATKLANKASDAASKVGAKVSDAASKVGEKASDAASKVREKFSAFQSKRKSTKDAETFKNLPQAKREAMRNQAGESGRRFGPKDESMKKGGAVDTKKPNPFMEMIAKKKAMAKDKKPEMKFAKGGMTRGGMHRMPDGKMMKNSAMNMGGMANMKKGGMPMKDGKPAFLMGKKMNMGGMAKYAKGGGIESHGKTKGTIIRMASGGSVSSASRRADGIAQRGKTRC